eukprot:4820175-Pyramimonas_sp.AAC.1
MFFWAVRVAWRGLRVKSEAGSCILRVDLLSPVAPRGEGPARPPRREAALGGPCRESASFSWPFGTATPL